MLGQHVIVLKTAGEINVEAPKCCLEEKKFRRRGGTERDDGVYSSVLYGQDRIVVKAVLDRVGHLPFFFNPIIFNVLSNKHCFFNIFYKVVLTDYYFKRPDQEVGYFCSPFGPKESSDLNQRTTNPKCPSSKACPHFFIIHLPRDEQNLRENFSSISIDNFRMGSFSQRIIFLYNRGPYIL